MTVNRLKDVREDNDFTQSHIARILQVSQQQYSRWETGAFPMPIGCYMQLAELYNISVDYLCGLIDTPRKLHETTR